MAQPKEYTVTVQQRILLPHRTQPDLVDRCFTVLAAGVASAANAVRNAGIKGEIIQVKPK